MTGLSTIPALNRIANRACTDILDQRLPGLFKTRLECAGEEWRDPLAAQLADIDAEIGDQTPPDDWISTARDIDVMALCMRFWCKRGAPASLIAKVDEFAQMPGLQGRIFARVKENIHVQ
jgi:hypothetical protein